MVSEKQVSRSLASTPAHTRFRRRAENAEPVSFAKKTCFLWTLTVLPFTPPSQNRTIHVIYSDRLMPVSFGNSAINDLYTADTPRA